MPKTQRENTYTMNIVETQMVANADDYSTVHAYQGLATFRFEKRRVP